MADQEIQDQDGGDLDKMREVLSRYAFLAHWMVDNVETKLRTDDGQSETASKPKVSLFCTLRYS